MMHAHDESWDAATRPPLDIGKAGRLSVQGALFGSTPLEQDLSFALETAIREIKMLRGAECDGAGQIVVERVGGHCRVESCGSCAGRRIQVADAAGGE